MKPVLQSLILARMVERLSAGGFLILGTFDTIRFSRANVDVEPNLPLSGRMPGSPYAYISLTDVCNGTELSLQFVSLKKNKVIFEQRITVSCTNRLETVEIVAALPHLMVPEAGVYAFEVVCEGEIIGSSRLRAIEDDTTNSESI